MIYKTILIIVSYVGNYDYKTIDYKKHTNTC